MKTCKLCNKTMQDNWTYCNDIRCKRLKDRIMYLKLKSEGKIPHHLYAHTDIEVKMWVCDCKEGFFIPIEFTKCVACKARQRPGTVHPRFHKLFNPNIHAIPLSRFFEEKEKASIKAI